MKNVELVRNITMMRCLMMSLLVTCYGDVMGSRDALFRPPAIDTTPWHPVGSHKTNLQNQVFQQRSGIIANMKKKVKAKTGKMSAGHIDEISNSKSSQSKDDASVNIQANIISEKDDKTHMKPKNIHEKLERLEKKSVTPELDLMPEPSEIKEMKVEWSEKPGRKRKMSPMQSSKSRQPKSIVNDPMASKAKEEESFYNFQYGSRTHRSAFIDPQELSGDMNHHDQMHHTDDMHHNNTNNYTNFQSNNPHDKGQFCVDISEYLDLKWVIKESEECIVNFNSQCEAKTENVCIDVTETKCEVKHLLHKSFKK